MWCVRVGFVVLHVELMWDIHVQLVLQEDVGFLKGYNESLVGMVLCGADR